MFRMRRQVYCDNNATTEVAPVVRRVMNRVLKDCFGNPSSLYRVARNSATVLEESRLKVSRAVNADPPEIFFSGSATEANNAVLKGVGEHYFPGRKKIISSPIEHASIAGTLDYLAGKGFSIVYLSVDRMGRVNPAELESLIDSDTFLVCCMLANNETGVIQDIRDIAAIAHRHGVLMMSDCVQALGKVPVDVRQLDLDYATFSAHKIHGPKGVGALYVRDGAPFVPLIHGGHQESGFRAGTEGVHNIAGFAAACEGIGASLGKAGSIADLKNKFIEGLRRIKADIIVNSPSGPCLPNTVSITFPGHSNAVFMAMLDFHGIAVSAGSACNTGDDKPSHVLKAIGLTDGEARQTIRFSFGPAAGERDIRYILRVVDDYLSGRIPPVNAITPNQLDENFLLDDRTFILDVRFWYDRKLIKGLPNSREIPFFTFHKHLDVVPRDRNVLVACQMGYNAPIVAYALKSRRYQNVAFLLTGVIGWKVCYPELYRKLAGVNIEKAGERQP